MTSALTRRGLVMAVPAAIVATSVPAIASTDSDAALLALRDAYERTLAAMKITKRPHSIAERSYFTLKSKRPDLDEGARLKLSGLDLAEEAWVQATDANGAVIDQLAETQAQTFEGVLLKARISAHEPNEPRLQASVVADLVAMGGAHA